MTLIYCLGGIRVIFCGLVRGSRNFGGGGRGAKDAVHGAPHQLCQRFGGSEG